MWSGNHPAIVQYCRLCRVSTLVWDRLLSRYRPGLSNTPAACGPRNYFVRPAAMSTNFKIFWIKTTCIIHFTRKKILFVLGPYLLTSTVLSRSRVTKLSVHILDFSFQLQWEQCCVKQLHFVVRPANWLLSSTAAHMLRWVWDPRCRPTTELA